MLERLKKLYKSLDKELEDNGDTDAADAIRDKMDAFWFRLDQKQVKEYNAWVKEYEENSKRVPPSSEEEK